MVNSMLHVMTSSQEGVHMESVNAWDCGQERKVEVKLIPCVNIRMVLLQRNRIMQGVMTVIKAKNNLGHMHVEFEVSLLYV